ncbi:MAG: hypothetical protein HYR72_16330 [Deltaproteobacteria bacterium]|nr:hypothetical protein [Deltaproteobacteria bacterium]MBI3389566.1 hypothetical protein [Deltaproteobacteria bacterium]
MGRPVTALPPPPATSLNTCQNTVKTASKTYADNDLNAVANCLNAVAGKVIKANAPLTTPVPVICVLQFRNIYDTRATGKSLGEKLTAAIDKKCAPGMLNVTHGVPDVLGPGAALSEPIEAENLDTWCTHFGGDGSIDTLHEWSDCVAASHACAAQQAIVTQYPRALEWLAEVRTAMLALTPPISDPNKISDAVAGLDAVVAAIDGPDDDGQPSVQCGGIVSTGTAVASSCLTGTTFSNGTAGGVAGTMPNNGAVTLTPSASDQVIAAGYHNGSGKCVGDTDLVSGNIKNGVNLFGVNGSVIQASGNAATRRPATCSRRRPSPTPAARGRARWRTTAPSRSPQAQ